MKNRALGCVYVHNFMQHSYIWSKILLSFPFSFVVSCVYINLLFGPERLDNMFSFSPTRSGCVLGISVYNSNRTSLSINIFYVERIVSDEKLIEIERVNDCEREKFQ